MERKTGYYNTFVVKIWCDEAERMMRGHVQHVSTQEHTYFLNLEHMTSFVISHLAPPPNDSATQDEAQGEAALLAENFGGIGRDE